MKYLYDEGVQPNSLNLKNIFYILNPLIFFYINSPKGSINENIELLGYRILDNIT